MSNFNIPLKIKTFFGFCRKNEEWCKKEIFDIYGWVRTVRSSSSNLAFCNINDGTNVSGLQIVITEENLVQSFTQSVKTGAYIFVKGNMVKSPSKGQEYELNLNDFKVIGNVEDNYILGGKTRINMDTLRSIPHLRCRTNVFGSIFRIRSKLMKLLHDFYEFEGFLHLDPNVITINECEGGAGVFQITEHNMSKLNPKMYNDQLNYNWSKDHFQKPVYLTVSSQLQLEALACGLGNVYTMNKSFRSEHSSTSKHVSEFTHLEIEMITDNMDDLMIISEKMIKYCIRNILIHNKEDINNLNKFVSKGIIDKLETIVASEFKKIKYVDIIEEINEDIKNKKCKNLSLINHGDDLSSDHENYITFKHGPTFITHWPSEIKSFYMKKCSDKTYCESYDLLMPFGVGELIGASMREDSYDILMESIRHKKINEKDIEFYTDLRKYGTCPHGGFGLGFDRLLMLITGISNIKDVIPFPVYYKSCTI